ncbi:TetR/AcrR family transcriptional regulator [Amycolatopsis taiwanensis]|uniref:TetR family transcriptional regulator n=1 Tax=Amycolatopsis taiwanensis TaxID=342230 RepID=A0A9W6R113_9PSEU|nr:TetR/AcrR family transcriptional regulator [Amycolatopsis taiwanensis]GLY67184.1 TetR family transcriptional regulator [Amycolatopsis taiwanensis]
MAYHHGDLRRTLLATAVEVIAESGPATLSLRELARRAGVSHAAPAHHFGDKAGLLTALATQGFDLLAEELAAAGPDLHETGVAYIRFAIGHRAHFEVMFRPELYHADDPEVTAARARATAILAERAAAVVGDTADSRAARLAAWSIAHGFAALWLGGAIPSDVGTDPEAAARPVLHLLFGRKPE